MELKVDEASLKRAGEPFDLEHQSPTKKRQPETNDAFSDIVMDEYDDTLKTLLLLKYEGGEDDCIYPFPPQTLPMDLVNDMMSLNKRAQVLWDDEEQKQFPLDHASLKDKLEAYLKDYEHGVNPFATMFIVKQPCNVLSFSMWH